MQLVRSSGSVAANIAEAAGRWHGPDRRQLLIVARGSLYETERWLATAAEHDLPLPDCAAQLDEAARTLQGLIDRQTAP